MDGGEALVLNGKILVANTGDDTLTCIDLKNKRAVETIDLKKLIKNNNVKSFTLDSLFIGPYEMVSNGRGLIYCTNAYDNSVFKIDIENKKIIDVISVGSFPTCIRYFKHHLYITNSDSNSISIIDEESFSLVENIPVGEKPTDIEIDENEMKIYVANSNGYSINIIDLMGKENRIIKLKDNPVKTIIEDGTMYILFSVNNSTIGNSNISVMDLQNYEKHEIFNLQGIFNSMLKINGGELVFLTNIDNGCLYRIDIKKGNLLSKTYLTGMPNKLEWDGDNVIYISNISTNTLSIFDIHENRITNNIKIGREPNGILILN